MYCVSVFELLDSHSKPFQFFRCTNILIILTASLTDEPNERTFSSGSISRVSSRYFSSHPTLNIQTPERFQKRMHFTNYGAGLEVQSVICARLRTNSVHASSGTNRPKYLVGRIRHSALSNFFSTFFKFAFRIHKP